MKMEEKDTMKDVNKNMLNWLRENISEENEDSLNKALTEEPERLSGVIPYFL